MAESTRDWLWLPESKPEPMLAFESIEARFDLRGNHTTFVKDLWASQKGECSLAGDAELELLKLYPDLSCFEPMKQKGHRYYFRGGKTRVWWDGKCFFWNCPYGDDPITKNSFLVKRNRLF